MKIQSRVFFSLLASFVLLVVILVQAMQWSMDRGLLDYVNQRQQAQFAGLTAALADHYRRNGGWQRLDERSYALLLRQHGGGAQHTNRLQRGEGAARSLQTSERPLPPMYSDAAQERGPGQGPAGRRGGFSSNPGRPPPRRQPSGDFPRGGAPPGGAPPGEPRAMPLLLAETGVIIAGRGRLRDDMQRLPVRDGDTVIATLVLPGHQKLLDDFELNFVAGQRQALIFVSVGVIALALLIALWFAPTIVRPLRRVAAGVHQLAQGQYDVDLDGSRRDELGDLSRDINELSGTLAHNQDLRQRWLAETSHELRTPISILKGSIEAMLDRVRPVTVERLRELLLEVNQLQKIIEDLSLLGSADIGSLQYRKSDVDLAELVGERADSFRQRADESGLTVTVTVPPGEVLVYADESRLVQMLENCFSNSLKYSDAPGTIAITLTQITTNACLTIEDSAPGVPDGALANLFDYLYRVDSSRSRATGGSGLGLAIVQRIAEGHGGSVAATHSPLGGIRITILIPLLDSPDDRARTDR